MVIDSHAHLHFDRFDEDRDAVIGRAQAAGVEEIVTIGTHLESSRQALALAEQYPFIHSTAGVHPLAVERFEEVHWLELESMWENPEIVGVGETGLDYYYTPETRDLQLSLFERHLKAAAEHSLPVVVHIRDAFDDAFALLKTHLGSAGGIVHCFTGGPAECARALALGMYISLSGIVTFKNANALREAVPMIPKDRLLVETDSPYLAPVPHRGKRCEPGFVVDTAKEVARLRGESYPELCAQTVANTRAVFSRM